MLCFLCKSRIRRTFLNKIYEAYKMKQDWSIETEIEMVMIYYTYIHFFIHFCVSYEWIYIYDDVNSELLKILIVQNKVNCHIVYSFPYF